MPLKRYVGTLLLAAMLACLATGCRKAATPPAQPSSEDDRAASPFDAAGDGSVPSPSHTNSPVTGNDQAPPGLTAAEPEQSSRTQLLAALSEKARREFLVGVQAMDDGDHELAVAAFTRAAHLHPDSTELLRALTEALSAAEQYDRAIDVYKHILAVDAGDLVTMYNLAVAYTRLEDYHLAERTYRKLLRIDERHLDARFNLATVYRAQGKLDDARRTWQACVAQDDDNAEAHASLGEVFLHLRQPQEALDHLRRASVLSPDDLVTHRQLAVAARLTGNYGWAATALERAAVLAPDDAEIWADLGQVLLTIHRDTSKTRFLDKAIAAWERSLDVNPDQPALREYLATYRREVPNND